MLKNPFMNLDNFCNREKEINQLILDMQNAQRVLLYSSRRVGKTWLLLKLKKLLEKNNFIVAYIDLQNIFSLYSWLRMYAKAVIKSAGKTMEEVTGICDHFLPGITLQIIKKGDSMADILLTWPNEIALTESITESIYNLPENIAASLHRKVVVIFDEFQEVIEINSTGGIEKNLRSFIQFHKNVGYIFSGSKKRIIKAMFDDKKRPFYRSAKQMSIDYISTDAWQKFIKKHFESSGYKIQNSTIELILQITNGHPYYTQRACEMLWSRHQPDKRISEKDVTNLVDEILKIEYDYFQRIWLNLTLPRRALLVAIAKSGGKYILSGDYIVSNNLGSLSTVKQSADYLLEQDILDKHEDEYVFTDLFFRQWIVKYVS